VEVVFLAWVAIDPVQLSLENVSFLNIAAFVVIEELIVVLDFVYQKIQIHIEDFYV
jgi:hypothetical protein